MASRLELRTEEAMKAAWERAAASQERSVSDWARRVLNEAAGYGDQPAADVVQLRATGTGGRTRAVAGASESCARAAMHRRGVYCKACGRTP